MTLPESITVSALRAVTSRQSDSWLLSLLLIDGVKDEDCWWTYSRCTTPKVQGLKPDVTKCDEPNSWGFTLDDGPNCSHKCVLAPSVLLFVNELTRPFVSAVLTLITSKRSNKKRPSSVRVLLVFFLPRSD